LLFNLIIIGRPIVLPFKVKKTLGLAKRPVVRVKWLFAIDARRALLWLNQSVRLIRGPDTEGYRRSQH